jgi:hypothetical protein
LETVFLTLSKNGRKRASLSLGRGNEAAYRPIKRRENFFRLDNLSVDVSAVIARAFSLQAVAAWQHNFYVSHITMF